MHLQREIELLFTVSFIVQAFLQPECAPLLLLVADHVELLLSISSHNTKGQLGIFSGVMVLCSELQNLPKHHVNNVHSTTFRLKSS